ncbi:MAG: DUF4129 domain-containing protein [Desulfobacterales bacterium]|nr:DUF4129 domain-containing protein [Desulfobacterales bacterium]
MNPKAKEHRRSAILLVEEAVHLLRKAPLFLLSAYAIGTLPFILALFYFWADMSRSANAQQYHAVASLGMALLYIWMKCWHVVFAARLKMNLNDQPPPRWSFQRLLSLVTTQTLIHATAFVVLPLAAVVALPFGWCYAFYQNVTVEAANENVDLKALCQKAWSQARLWPRQNHIVMSIFFIFGIVVFLNVASAIYILPHLVKKYLGIESLFTLSGFHVINTTFWAVAIGISYLFVNPLVKTVYVLRCFYGAAIHSGDDLKLGLKALVAGRTSLVIGLVAMGLLISSPLRAVNQEQQMVAPEALDRSIDDVMQQREFMWRMPRDMQAEDQTQPQGPIAAVVTWIVDKIGEGIDTVIDWIDRLIDWLLALFPSAERPKTAADTDWVSLVQFGVIALLIGLVVVLAYIVWRSLSQRQIAQAEIAALPADITPDLENEDTTADDLPPNRWLDLARELAGKGSLRLALRAFYLASLAGLAEHGLITVEKFKSNREYEMELQRRAHQKQNLLTDFAQSSEIFERVWYGLHAIKESDLDQFAALQKRVISLAKS